MANMEGETKFQESNSQCKWISELKILEYKLWKKSRNQKRKITVFM